ncbi:serine/threonine-protein kinase [Sporobolomyces koalae]|uniref:serine/threonine-protein kinase n=1 Tax=Sporobolomyces koalae TaxID=500713 RepID=UPI003179F4A1
MRKILKLLRTKGASSTDSDSPHTSPRPRVAPVAVSPPSPPHELPALQFSRPLSHIELPLDQDPDPAPPTAAVERASANSSAVSTRAAASPAPAPLPPLETSVTNPSPSVIPPTPIEPPPTALPDPDLGRAESTPPVASTSSLHPTYSSPTTSTHLFPPSSPSLSVSTRSGSPARRGGHHRRSSSTGSRSFRETLNAYAVEDANGQRCVNQYIIASGSGPLGKGTYAVVEKAVDRETNTEYAIKEFSKRRLRHIAAAEQQRRERLAAREGPTGRSRGSRRGRGRGRGGANMKWRTSPEDEPDSGPDNLDLVRTEVAIMKKVDHPNIASVHEVIDVTSDDALLIMELCRGGPIMKLRDGEHVEPYSEDKTRDIFRQLTLGIAYLHHNEIVHRDIKPDNALFADVSKTHVKLVDFGVSKFARAPAPGAEDHHDTRSKIPPANSVAGSPAYMAPELIDSSDRSLDDETGFACDCWSLGVTLYVLAVGHLPFQSLDPLELFRSIREDDPKVPETLSPALQDLLHKLLDRDPTTRATIPSLWEDAWLTESGTAPLPDYDENVSYEIDEPSPAELHHALAMYRGSTFLALSAAAKFKGLLNAAATRRASQEKENSIDGTTTPPLQRSGSTTPALVDSPSNSPSLEPIRSLSPPSLHVLNGGGGASAKPGSSAASSRKLPRRFDTVSSLSIGEERDEDEDGAVTSRATTPEQAREKGGQDEPHCGVDASGVEDFERDGQTWEEPE